MEQPNYYAIIPADVRYDCRLTDKEKLLYAEITALSTKEGCCWASNSYFSGLYKVTPETISRSVTKLINNGYLMRVVTYKENSKEIDKRYLYPLTKTSIPIDENINTPIDKIINTPIDENVKDNNTRKNNTSNNNSITNSCIIKNASKFSVPTIEELQSYIEEKGLSVDAVKFHSYYESNGWKVGKNKMSNWKAALITWERNDKEKNGTKKKNSMLF